MIKHILHCIIFSLTLMLLSACGGGGGGGGASTPGTPGAKTTATVKISLNGTIPAGKTIAGTEFTLTLPANVSPAMVSGVVATSVVTPSGTFVGSSIAPGILSYSPAVGVTPGTLRLFVANSVAGGVTSAGEVATIVLQLASGATPVDTDFALNSVPLIVVDASGDKTTITGMSASVSAVTLQ